MDPKLMTEKSGRLAQDIQGRVAVPILLYVLGVPGFFCAAVWLVFFRGR